MFKERRSQITAGIDKSYLLEPIAVDTKSISTKPPPRQMKTTNRNDQKSLNYSKVIVPPLQNRLINHDINGNNHFTAGDETNALVNFKTTTKVITKTNGTSTNGAATRKLTPTVTSNINATSAPLKNVTNQKVSCD